MRAAVAKAQDRLNRQKAHTVMMIEAGQPIVAVRAAKRLVYVFEMQVSHLYAGKSAASFDIAAAGAEARKWVR
jgi:hypothetical protein